jgi:predicted ATP-binding protein involved in virulence
MCDIPLRINGIELSNYRCFVRLRVDFHPELTVIAARNGCGKTAILDAVAVALGPFVGAFDEARGAHFAGADVRLARSPGAVPAEMEAQYPLTLEARGIIADREATWRRGLASAKARTTYAGARVLIDYGKRLERRVRDAAEGRADSPPVLPLVSYYGTGRLWSEMRLSTGRKSKGGTSRMKGYADCLTSASRYKAFANWFERLCRAEYEERENPRQLNAIRGRLSAIREAVDLVLRPSGWRGIAFKSAEAGIVAEHDDYGVVPVSSLSDGIRNLVGLAADIAHRAVRLNSHFGENAVRRTPGIVLIDEVDMHLHPEWQQIVIESLRGAFPGIQFILTTHSPQVLSTVHRESVRIVRRIEDEWVFEPPEFQTRGVESADVLAGIMGVDPVPQVEEARTLRDYRALIESDRHGTEEARRLRSNLVAHFGERHPLILDCDRLIRFQSFKLRRANTGTG